MTSARAAATGFKLTDRGEKPLYKSKIVLKQKGSKNLVTQFELLVDGFIKAKNWFNSNHSTTINLHVGEDASDGQA